MCIPGPVLSVWPVFHPFLTTPRPPRPFSYSSLSINLLVSFPILLSLSPIDSIQNHDRQPLLKLVRGGRPLFLFGNKARLSPYFEPLITIFGVLRFPLLFIPQFRSPASREYGCRDQ